MRKPLAALLAVLALVAAACDSSPSDPTAQRTTPPPSPSTAPSANPSPSVSPAPAAAHAVSLPALMRKNFDGRDFRVGRVIRRNSAYTRYFITYRSGPFRISGIMNVPAGNGPFPALVFNHGHIDPEIYRNGQGLGREQDYLTRRGYVIVHTDYRNHAQSDDDPRNELNVRLGYTEDVINAVLAIRSAKLPYIDVDRIGMLGRSMGGGITYNALVVAPQIVKVAVVYASVSTDYVDNFNKWVRRGRPIATEIMRTFGSPERNPAFWRDISAVNFFDRIAVPVQIHHGTDDQTCPIAWTNKTVAALKSAGKSYKLEIYQGEHHEFVPQWLESIRRTRAFLDRYLKA